MYRQILIEVLYKTLDTEKDVSFQGRVGYREALWMMRL